MNITVFTIAFNGYGQFVNNWLDSILNQTTKPNEIIMVLGINHNTPKDVIKKAEQNNVKIIYEKEKKSMGNLINQAIYLSQSEWLLRIDVDDILLPNAIQEIKNKSDKCDAVSLKFLRNGIEKISPIPEQSKMMNWRKHYNESGYVAIKKQFNGNTLYYDDNDFANFPYLFKAAYLGMKFELTDNACSVYQKRTDSHSTTLRTPEQNKEAYRTIDEAAIKYSQKDIKLSIIIPVHNTGKYIKRCLQSIELRNDIEIIIIDDYSTDNSVDIITEWIDKVKFNNIIFIQNPENLGVGATVNNGYDIMHGDADTSYVMTLCDDDYLLAPISKLVDELDGTDLVYYDMINNNGKIWRGIKLPGSTKAYRKGIIGNTRRGNQNFGGDKIFYQEILKKNPTKKDTGLLLYYYNYPRTGSLMDIWKKVDINMKQITVYGIVYNNYGGFIPQWVKYMKKQTLKPDIIIALGKDHGADLEWLEKNKIKYVLCDSDNMGRLRNAALEKVTTPFHLYFSIDDELLPDACEFIVNQDADALSIRYNVIEPDGRVKTNWPSPKMNTLEDLYNWEKMWGGYVAIKGNHDIRYREDIAVPNLSFHFELFKRGITTIDSNKVLIIHHRRLGSHYFKSVAEGITKDFIVEINKTREEVISNLLKKGKLKEEEFEGYIEPHTLICTCQYKDSYLKEKVIKKKNNITEIYKKYGKILTIPRANLLISKGKAKRV